MIKNLKLYSIIITVFLFVGYSLITNHKLSKLKTEIIHWQNVAAKKDTIKIVDETLINKLALQVDELQSKNKTLNKIITKQKSTINSQINIIADLEVKIDSLKTVDDTIIIDGDSTAIRVFETEKNGISISGYFEKFSPFRITFTKILAVFDLEANIIQNKDKSWITYIDTKNKAVKINSVITKVVPYKPTWKEEIKFGIGGGINKNNVSIFTQLIYYQYSLLLGMTSNGVFIGSIYYIR